MDCIWCSLERDRERDSWLLLLDYILRLNNSLVIKMLEKRKMPNSFFCSNNQSKTHRYLLYNDINRKQDILMFEKLKLFLDNVENKYINTNTVLRG